MGDGVVAEEVGGDLAAAADQAGGVSAHKMDQENAAPDAGKQHLPPEDQTPHKLSAGDSDRGAKPAEQPEEERPQGRLRRNRRGALRAGPSTFSLRGQGWGWLQSESRRAPC